MRVRLLGLVLGPLLFLAAVLLPPLKSPVTNKLVNPMAPRVPNIALGLMLWVIVWWITEAAPFGVTALIAAIVAATVAAYSPQALGYSSSKHAISGVLETFFHRIIWVFWGGLMLAYGMETSGMAKRIVAKVIELCKRRGILLCVVLWFLGWFLSWWMSNTAATALLYPIVLGIVTTTPVLTREQREIVLIGLAFAASLGGMATLIGTPPNLVATGYLEEKGIASISFFEWMKFGLPISTIFFLIMVAVLGTLFGKVEIKEEVYTAIRRHLYIEVPEKMSSQEKWFLFTFIVVISLWILRGLSSIIAPLRFIGKIVPDDSIPAILAGVLLFGVPRRVGDSYEFFFDWKDALAKMDWDTLFLFAGGLVMGDFLFRSRAGLWLGEKIVDMVGGASSATAILYATVILTWALTQVASNTATTNAIVPIAISICLAASMPAQTTTYIVVAIALAASIALTLPVSTPPNAIVFAGGQVRIKTMAKYGLILSVIYLPLLFVLLRVFY